MKKDALGRPINVGDVVAFADSYGEIPSTFKTSGGLPVSRMTACYVFLKYHDGYEFRISPEKVFNIQAQVAQNAKDFPEYYI